MRIALTVIAALALGAWITVCMAWVDDRQRRIWHRTCTRLARHARRIKTLEERLESLAAALGYEFTEEQPADDVSPNCAAVEEHSAPTEEQPTDDDTDEIPAQPQTEPMSAIPARVDDVPLARVSAEIEADGRIEDVELAWILAELQDRIEGWRRDREVTA